MSWNNKNTGQKILNGVQAVLGLSILSTGVSAIYATQTQPRRYVISALLGGVAGYMILDTIFMFSWDYPSSDENGELKGKIRGAFVGASLATGIAVLADKNTNVFQKNVVSAGMGSLFGYMLANAEYLGEYSDAKNISAGIGGGLVGLGIYNGVRKVKDTKVGQAISKSYNREDSMVNLIAKGAKKQTA